MTWLRTNRPEGIRTLAALGALALLSVLFLLHHFRAHGSAAGTAAFSPAERVLELTLALLSGLVLAYGEYVRRALDRQLREQERSDIAQRAAGLGTWEHDLRTGSLVWSAETSRVFGLAPSDIQPTYETFLGLVHPEDRATLITNMRAAFEAGELGPFRFRIVRADGALRTIQSCGRVLFEGSQPVRLIGTAQDVTERVITEQSVRAREERYQLAWMASHGAVWEWNPATNEIWCSDGFARLFGYADPSVYTSLEFWLDSIHPEDVSVLRERVGEFIASSERYLSAEYRLRRADATYADVLVRGYLVRDDHERPVRFVGSILDVTDQKHAERLKNDFASFASHQLRTPLSGINWMLELALEGQDMTPQSEAYVRDAQAAARRLTGMVNDLLEAARLESGRAAVNPEPLTFEAVTRAVADEFTPQLEAKSHYLTIEASDSTPVTGDPRLVREAIKNLVSNAIKYTPREGHIRVSIIRLADEVRWSVSDTGVGIPADARPRIFDKFFRAGNVNTFETEGTGLGLHLVKLIVERHGGRVWCESVQGEGSTFSFTLPTVKEHVFV